MAVDPELEEALASYVEEDYGACFAKLVPMLRRRHIGAIAFLGAMYSAGESVPRDVERAERYLSRAAKAGDALAAHNLSTLFITALYDRPDYLEESRRWAELAKINGFDMGI